MSHGSHNQRFRPRERLRLRRDFDRVFAAKCSVADAALVVYAVPNHLTWSRLGLSVSVRMGNAVVRNYVRRRLREAFRLHKEAIPKGLDIVCVARGKAADRTHDIARSLVTLIARLASVPGRREN